MAYYSEAVDVFSTDYLERLAGQILASPYLAGHNLTRDFVGTRGFSIAFRVRSSVLVEDRFPWARSYLRAVLDPDCNAFYLNPLVMGSAARVDPHVDRSLRSYCRTISTPKCVSVLYVKLHEPRVGGELVLRAGRREVARILPVVNKVVTFQGDLTHLVTPIEPLSEGLRISLVCEQYALEPDALAGIPDIAIESRGKRY